MNSCEQEMCQHWTGDGCACAVFDLNPDVGQAVAKRFATLNGGLVGHPEPTPDANKDLVYRVMQAIAGPPGKDEDVFLTAGEEVNIYALRSGEITLTADCSDFFSYATADAEPITAENVDLFEQCIRDLIAIDEWGGYSRLFCIRIRKQLPLKYHLGKAIPQVAELWEAAVSS